MPLHIEVIGIPGMPEVHPRDDLAALILEASGRAGISLVEGDILVVAQKVVSKAEGRLVPLERVEPSALARRLAQPYGKDPRSVEVVLGEAARIVRADRGVLITETEHGFVCANSGVDGSNLEKPETLALLPEAPDRSAAALRGRIEEATGGAVGVIISDTFGRPWREGATNIAIGLSGLEPLIDYRGEEDTSGRRLESTVVAVVDELTAAAELVMGKLDRVPAAVIRGYGDLLTRKPTDDPNETGISPVIRKPEYDLFR